MFFHLGSSAKPKTEGTLRKTSEPYTKSVDATIDYDKLYYAVSMAESSGGTSRLAQRTNNHVSIMCWTKKGKRYLCQYKSVEANKAAFVALWKRVYKTLPTPAIAKKYTGNDSPTTWLKTTLFYYNKP